MKIRPLNTDWIVIFWNIPDLCYYGMNVTAPTAADALTVFDVRKKRCSWMAQAEPCDLCVEGDDRLSAYRPLKFTS